MELEKMTYKTDKVWYKTDKMNVVPEKT